MEFTSKDIEKIVELDTDNIRHKLEDFDLADKTIALYGTGMGAEVVLDALKDRSVLCYIDRRESKYFGQKFCGLNVCALEDIYDKVDVIVVVARVYHNEICERIKKYICQQDKVVEVIDIYGHNTAKEKIQYCEYIEECSLKSKEDFAPYEDKAYVRREEDTKLIAWYLPQYHQIELNDIFHGKGFTEWTNATQARPVFCGHYQPHIPYDVGFYDLMLPETFKRQIELAKNYGIYGFCFHYYWFAGKRIMEKPIELFLEHKEFDFPFCLHWANENWTALWDAGNDEIMLEQDLSEEAVEGFIDDILPYFQDERYIKIDGKPVLLFYRNVVHEKEDLRRVFTGFKKKCESLGLGGLYIILTTAGNYMRDATEFNADAIVEFPPWIVSTMCRRIRPAGYVNPDFKGEFFDLAGFVDNKEYFLEYGSKEYYRSAMASYDNTARKFASGAAIYTGMTPYRYKKWVKDIIAESKTIHEPDKDYVFLNSWNEWAEGSHLEPDMKYGYGWLEAVYEALMENRR
ncbi:MAG: hypothetical protein E7265_01915 [Lachnospiraceae bacterium]|nr:hypothetical protein [Lachnospiraceae bacterium]